MINTLPMKFNGRWRRLVWRMQSPYSIFVGSCVLSLAGVKHFMTSAGASDSHRQRVAHNGTYAKRHYAEVNDNPLYRLPENAAGGHRLDGLSQQQARKAALAHH